MRAIGSGIVAEKSATCRGVGTSESIRSTSSMKPIFSISSASSRHDHAHLGQIERAAIEMIDEPSRRADDDVRAALQMLHLPEDRRAAVDGKDRDAVEFLRVRMHGIRHLHGQLARRREHERLRGLALQSSC